jgi:hypothetical protein
MAGASGDALIVTNDAVPAKSVPADWFTEWPHDTAYSHWEFFVIPPVQAISNATTFAEFTWPVVAGNSVVYPMMVSKPIYIQPEGYAAQSFPIF